MSESLTEGPTPTLHTRVTELLSVAIYESWTDDEWVLGCANEIGRCG